MTAPNGHAGSSPTRPAYTHDVLGPDSPECPIRFTSEQIREIVLKLEVPFEPAVITWRTTNMSKDKSRGQVVPYADQRAYTDRLNQLLTPGGWTRKYKVDATGSFERSKDQKVVAKIVVTCELTVFGLGTHSATGEEWADDENAATAAEAQAFKRACCCLGLGRYLYHFVGVWVDLDNHKRPKRIPKLPEWATPSGWTRGARPDSERQSTPQVIEDKNKDRTSSSATNSELVPLIEKMAVPLGKALYRGILKSAARVWTPRSIQDHGVAKRVLEYMQAAERGLARLQVVLEKVGAEPLQQVLSNAKIRSLDQIDSLDTLKQVVVSLESIARG